PDRSSGWRCARRERIPSTGCSCSALRPPAPSSTSSSAARACASRPSARTTPQSGLSVRHKQASFPPLVALLGLIRFVRPYDGDQERVLSSYGVEDTTYHADAEAFTRGQHRRLRRPRVRHWVVGLDRAHGEGAAAAVSSYGVEDTIHDPDAEAPPLGRH